MAGRLVLIDLRSIGFNRPEWQSLKVAANEIKVEPGVLVAVAERDYLRRAQKRRR
jgi:hypothetical protein